MGYSHGRQKTQHITANAYKRQYHKILNTNIRKK